MVASFWHTVPWGKSEGTGGGPDLDADYSSGVDKDLAGPVSQFQNAVVFRRHKQGSGHHAVVAAFEDQANIA
jgi:hypothetical protein